MNPWLIFSLVFLIIWFFIYILISKSRKEMLLTSIFTAPFGLTEPIFVPEYWSPPSLFNLALTTGFDIESIIFSFSIGGIGSVLYEALFSIKHEKLSRKKMHNKRHNLHLLALFSPFIVFLILMPTKLNSIYSVSISLFIGAIAALLCRPDLKKKTFLGGILFLLLYFVAFLLFTTIYPNAVEQYWNLNALSGILILNIPLEELLFAFTFGMMWSSVYEHITYNKVK